MAIGQVDKAWWVPWHDGAIRQSCKVENKKKKRLMSPAMAGGISSLSFTSARQVRAAPPGSDRRFFQSLLPVAVAGGRSGDSGRANATSPTV